MQFFVIFLLMLVVFVVVEYEISHIFGGNVSTFLLNKPQTKCFPDGCHENVFLATF